MFIQKSIFIQTTPYTFGNAYIDTDVGTERKYCTSYMQAVHISDCICFPVVFLLLRSSVTTREYSLISITLFK